MLGFTILKLCVFQFQWCKLWPEALKIHRHRAKDEPFSSSKHLPEPALFSHSKHVDPLWRACGKLNFKVKQVNRSKGIETQRDGLLTGEPRKKCYQGPYSSTLTLLGNSKQRWQESAEGAGTGWVWQQKTSLRWAPYTRVTPTTAGHSHWPELAATNISNSYLSCLQKAKAQDQINYKTDSPTNA